MRDFIVSEIQRLAGSTSGKPPGQKLFAKETGIAVHQWRGRFWPRWGDALIEAGFAPNDWTSRLETTEVLSSVIAACRHYRRLATNAEMEIFARSEPSMPSMNTLRRHFGTRPKLVAALVEFIDKNPAYADVAVMLPANAQITAERPTVSAKIPEGFVYLIQAGEFYKIGRSDDIERRFKEIRIALPAKAVLIHSIRTDDPPGIEAYWHQRFRDRRANGEWFKLTTMDVAAFKKRKFQ